MAAGESGSAHQQAAHWLWYGGRAALVVAGNEAGWRAVRLVASADGSLSDSERECLAARMVSQGAAELVDPVLAWQAGEANLTTVLAELQLAPEARRGAGAWLIYNALCVALADGQLASTEMEAVKGVARALELEPQMVDALIGVVLDEASSRKRRLDTFERLVPAVVTPAVTPAMTPALTPAMTPAMTPAVAATVAATEAATAPATVTEEVAAEVNPEVTGA